VPLEAPERRSTGLRFFSFLEGEEVITERLTRAAGYLRRSTNKQEKSLEDQRREIERYAEAHSYKIVVWFVDDGISGDDTDKRAGFQRMHADACNGKDFEGEGLRGHSLLGSR